MAGPAAVENLDWIKGFSERPDGCAPCPYGLPYEYAPKNRSASSMRESAAANVHADGGPWTTWSVVVVTTENKKLNMRVTSAGEKAGVRMIVPGGLIAEYNAANPSTAFMADDIIESVNGTTGDKTAITDAIKAAAAGTTLTL